MKTAMILWGSSGAYGTDGSTRAHEYRDALRLIADGSALCGYKLYLVVYPGHPSTNGITTGQLSFHSALQKVRAECRIVQPQWIIGRSLGAPLASAALNCQEEWVRHCAGAVLWGPGFRTQMNRFWPTAESTAQAVEDCRTFQTHLTADYFETLPDVESLVVAAECNLRLARGSLDKYNSAEDLRQLERLHAKAQTSFSRHVVIFDHTPTRAKLDDRQIELYFRCLFSDCFDQGFDIN